jgi:Raf kinase inhibitor-like YbhB/YbcL family protein
MPRTMTLSSAAFANGSAIPNRYTCSGDDVSPPLGWTGAPRDVQSLALAVIDPDAPGKPWVHWLIFNLPPATSGLSEAVPKSKNGPDGSLQGRNDFGHDGYGGPCPPPGPAHHYHFTIYALDSTVNLSGGAHEDEFQRAIRGHVLTSGELIGTFGR